MRYGKLLWYHREIGTSTTDISLNVMVSDKNLSTLNFYKYSYL